MQREKYSSIDEFIDDFEGVTRERLITLRRVIRDALPTTAQEKISYNIPCFTLDPQGKGYLVYFAGYAHHVSLYPVPQSLPEDIKREVAHYQKGKGTLQFSHDEELPLPFIRTIVECLRSDYEMRKIN